VTPPPGTEGTTLGGRYVLTERIAVGGMGEVWAATDTVLGRAVAVKLLHPGLSQEGDFAERFRAEARHSASLHHPNIATVFDYGEDDGTAYLVMELVPGQPLSRIIAERAPLSAPETSSILAQAATALEAAHQGGVVHRDVKPANIIITPSGTTKLTDFGISRAIDTAPLTQTGQVLGTAQYLSPEQALGQSATASSDIYSLGVVGYEMLTGTRPFDADTVVATALAHVNQPPPPLPDTIPAGIRDVVEAALAKDPTDRPASAAAMARALGMPGPTLDADDPTRGTEGNVTATYLLEATTPTPTAGRAATGLAAANATPADQAAPTEALAATRAMPALTQAMAEQAMPTQPTGIPDLRSRGGRRRSAALVPAIAAAAVLLVIVVVALASGGGGTQTPAPKATATATTATTARSEPTTSATAVVAPPSTSPAPIKPAPGKGSGKGKGKQ